MSDNVQDIVFIKLTLFMNLHKHREWTKQMFKKTVSARSVAEDGYNGMLKGKLDVVSGLTTSQKIMMAMIPFIPKKMLLKQVRQMQEI